MPNSLLSHSYLALVTAAMGLMAIRIVDHLTFDGQMTYPGDQANAWTWAIRISFALAVAPWIFAGAVLGTQWALRRTIGVPSEMSAPAPVRVREDRRY